LVKQRYYKAKARGVLPWLLFYTGWQHWIDHWDSTDQDNSPYS